MRKTLVIVLVIFLIIALVALGLVAFNDNDEADTSVNGTGDPAQQAEEISQPADNTKDIETESVQLVSVRDTSESGVAERYVGNEGKYTLVATAELKDLPEDKFYEGWVVGDGKVISTGMLNPEGGGLYSLIFTSEDDLFAQNQVVITEETLSQGLDNKPEDHVIEGAF